MKCFIAVFWICFIFLSVCTTCRGQSVPLLHEADSLYQHKQWAEAKKRYTHFLGDSSKNSMFWNRLGFCNQKLGLYDDAMMDYEKALSFSPSVPVKSSALSRMAMIYSLKNNPEKSGDWLIQAAIIGYANLDEVDTSAVFQNLRNSPNYKNIREKIYGILYPCSREPRNRDFDFWVGDWACYQTGTQNYSGSSHVEIISGGCAILENYTSSQAYSGKSFNFYDTISKKWKQDWIGSGGPSDRLHFDNGVFEDGKMHFTYESTNAAGEKQHGNFIFYFIDSNTVRQYQDITDDQGKTVSVVYDLTYLRKK